MAWFLYDNGHRHERVNPMNIDNKFNKNVEQRDDTGKCPKISNSKGSVTNASHRKIIIAIKRN